MRAALLALALAACARSGTAIPSAAELPEPSATLRGIDSVAQPPQEHSLEKRVIAVDGPLQLLTGFDPYYRREMRFWAVPLGPLLHRLFPGVDLASEELVLRAKDGYAVAVDGPRLLDGTAYLALADADRMAVRASNWEPAGPQHADPGPFYLVWKGADRIDLERYPRPWGVVEIERARFETLYPHTVPQGGDVSAQQGFSIFRRDCIRCHAINREGGHVGPDLNVPQSIVEYRPRPQIRAYIRDPLTFRYGTMPSHPHLTDADLDGLVAYFEVMKTHKHDPDRP